MLDRWLDRNVQNSTSRGQQHIAAYIGVAVMIGIIYKISSHGRGV